MIPLVGVRFGGTLLSLIEYYFNSGELSVQDSSPDYEQDAITSFTNLAIPVFISPVVHVIIQFVMRLFPEYVHELIERLIQHGPPLLVADDKLDLQHALMGQGKVDVTHSVGVAHKGCRAREILLRPKWLRIQGGSNNK